MDFLKEFAEQHGFIGVFRVSAKENIDIASVFSILTKEMLIKEIREMENQPDESFDKPRSDGI